MAELLLELLSEEIPARMQARAAGDLMRLIGEGLEKAGLAHDGLRAFATPRRLAVVAEGLPTTQPDRVEDRKGPRDTAPDQALAGSLRAVGIDAPDLAAIRALEANGSTLEIPVASGIVTVSKQADNKGAHFSYAIHQKGQQTQNILWTVIAGCIFDFVWPKSMRWAYTSLRWVRPLHSIIAIFDGEIIEQEVQTGVFGVSPPGMYAGSAPLENEIWIRFGNTTRGHRFLAPDPFTVTGFDDYKTKLEAAHVILDARDRRDRIEAAIKEKAAAEGLSVRPDPALLDEVAGLVEWPVALIGSIDAAFMALPPEVLTTAMRAHQKYFALEDTGGRLAPRFAVIANIEAQDGGAAIRAGNERVLRARLADARFFWDQDRKMRLEDRLPRLREVIFHARLGSVAERVERVAALARLLSEAIPGCDKALAERAAGLAKADLTGEMVGEFPELQGVMGRYYALEQGEDKTVADAIADHYSPAGPNDACPTAPVSVAVALAEKLDTLAGFWLIGETPTGSKDPYALRRAALGVIRLVLENGLRLKLGRAFAGAAGLYAEQGTLAAGLDATRAAGKALMAFFADRLKVHLREEGVRHDLIGAVFALEGEDDLVRLVARVRALQAFVESEDGANLLVAYRRAANILRIEEKKDAQSYEPLAEARALVEAGETALFAALESTEARVRAALQDEDFDAAMHALAGLRADVDRFFDEVTVNAEDASLRRARLGLLARIRDVMGHVAAFGEVEG